MARRIASDSMPRRLVLDTFTGKPVDVGRNSYRPSRPMRRWTDVRDRGCRFPNCRCRAVYCDIDHQQEWDRGGGTSCDNCALLCRRHHNYKTSKAWESERDDTGTLTWLSPHGFTWTSAEPDYDDYYDAPLPEPPPPTCEADELDDRLEPLLFRLWTKAG